MCHLLNIRCFPTFQRLPSDRRNETLRGDNHWTLRSYCYMFSLLRSAIKEALPCFIHVSAAEKHLESFVCQILGLTTQMQPYATNIHPYFYFQGTDRQPHHKTQWQERPLRNTQSRRDRSQRLGHHRGLKAQPSVRGKPYFMAH